MAKSEPPHKRSASPTTKAPGKQPKHFLAQKEALQLAASIADAQESKTLSRLEKQRQPQLGHPRSDRTHRVPNAKERIKEKKAALVAQRAHSKKEKAKLRKAQSEGNQNLRVVPKSGLIRKTVSFA